MIKKLNKILLLLILAAAALTVSAFASGEPSGEMSASGEPAASGEPSAEPEEEAGLHSFDVTINVNGDEYTTVSIGVGIEDNVYTLRIKELLDAVGVNLTYDEETDVATVTAEPDSLMEVLFLQMENKAAADSASGEPSGEPGASEEPAPPEEPEASGEPGASAEPAASGEPSGEAAAAPSEPATEAEFEAYTDYLRQYMTDYDGVGDGTFDDSARAMAIGELDSVAFGADVNAFPFEMYITQFGAKDYATFAGGG